MHSPPIDTAYLVLAAIVAIDMTINIENENSRDQTWDNRVINISTGHVINNSLKSVQSCAEDVIIDVTRD